MLFGSSWQMPCAGFIVFVYGTNLYGQPIPLFFAFKVANFLAFVGETTYSLATIAETPEADNYQEYFRAVTNGTVRVITMLMCGWWIISANKARTTGMKVAFAWILLRAVGNVMYAYGCVLYETAIVPENLMSLLGGANTFSHTTRLASATSWLLGEAFVLSRMHAFYCVTTTPDYWQIHVKEQTLVDNEKASLAPSK
ncbi:uncharacterized protein LOC119391141 [Rhipicephalus sanguineus]|uniref:uncharacterized protein LOC119391141 n=1 Tax=Rhipicephalus sanguineus TaxID=34632 RepID=UPI0018934820|nr:uncharacterized protein LOC119391141 [Rhipicephalus sanguineus]